MKYFLIILLVSVFVLDMPAREVEKDLFWQVKTGNLRKIREFFDNIPDSNNEAIDFDYTDPISGKTLVMFAAEKGEDRIVDLFLEEAEDDIDLELTDKDGKTALIYAVRSGDLSIVKSLIEAEAEVDTADSNDVTPLMHALIEKREEIALYLMKKGADINAKDVRKGTPLMYAVANDMQLAAEELVKNGAERFAKNVQGLTAFDVAEQVNSNKMVAILNLKEMSGQQQEKQIKLFRGSAGTTQTGGTAITIILMLIVALFVLREKFGGLKKEDENSD